MAENAHLAEMRMGVLVSHDQSSHVNLRKNRLSEIKAAQGKLAEESREVAAKIEEVEQNSIEVLRSASLSLRWVKATYEERRAVCQFLIREVRLDAEGNAEVVWNI